MTAMIEECEDWELKEMFLRAVGKITTEAGLREALRITADFLDTDPETALTKAEYEELISLIEGLAI